MLLMWAASVEVAGVVGRLVLLSKYVNEQIMNILRKIRSAFFTVGEGIYKQKGRMKEPSGIILELEKLV